MHLFLVYNRSMAKAPKKTRDRPGQPTKYKPEYCEQILAFFNVEPTKFITEITTFKNGTTKEREVEVANNLPTLERFAFNLGVSRDSLQEWAKVHPEFSVAYKRAKELQEQIWKVNALNGNYNAAFAIFMGKNVYGYKDKTEVDQNVSVVQMPTIEMDGKPLDFDIGKDPESKEES